MWTPEAGIKIWSSFSPVIVVLKDSSLILILRKFGYMAYILKFWYFRKVVWKELHISWVPIWNLFAISSINLKSSMFVPLFARSTAVSLPMPVFAPVIITVLPSRRVLLWHLPPAFQRRNTATVITEIVTTWLWWGHRRWPFLHKKIPSIYRYTVILYYM